MTYLTHFDRVFHHTQINIFFYVLFGEKIATFIRRNIFNNKADYYLGQNLEKCKKWAMNAHKKYKKDDLKTYYDHTYHELSKNLPNAKYDEIITRTSCGRF